MIFMINAVKICHGCCQDLVKYSTARKVLKEYTNEASLEEKRSTVGQLELTTSSA